MKSKPWPFPNEVTRLILDNLVLEREQRRLLINVCTVWRDIVERESFKSITKTCDSTEKLETLCEIITKPGRLSCIQFLRITFEDLVATECFAAIMHIMAGLSRVERRPGIEVYLTLKTKTTKYTAGGTKVLDGLPDVPCIEHLEIEAEDSPGAAPFAVRIAESAQGALKKVLNFRMQQKEYQGKCF